MLNSFREYLENVYICGIKQKDMFKVIERRADILMEHPNLTMYPEIDVKVIKQDPILKKWNDDYMELRTTLRKQYKGRWYLVLFSQKFMIDSTTTYAEQLAHNFNIINTEVYKFQMLGIVSPKLEIQDFGFIVGVSLYPEDELCQWTEEERIAEKYI